MSIHHQFLYDAHLFIYYQKHYDFYLTKNFDSDHINFYLIRLFSLIEIKPDCLFFVLFADGIRSKVT
jgi:hypothetical protein